MANPATTLARTIQPQDARIPGLPVLPAGTNAATLTVPVYNPATDQTHQAPIGGPAPVTNAILGGAKVVQYADSRYFGVPAGALTLDRLLPATIVPGNLATVDNPATTPLTVTEPPRQYVATLVAAGTAGAVLVPRYLGAMAGDTVPIVWQEVVTGSAGGTATLVRATLTKAQALLTASAIPASTFGSQYAITGPWNNPNPVADSTVYVVALSATAFALLGSVLDSTGVVQTVSVDVAAGTWEKFGVDAYTKTQADALLATKAALDANGKVLASQLPDAVAMYEFVGTLSQPQAVVKDAFYYVAGRGLYQRTGASASVTSLDTTNTASWKVVIEQAEEVDIFPSQAKRTSVINSFSAGQKKAADVALAGDNKSYFFSKFYHFPSDYYYECFPNPDDLDANNMPKPWWIKLANN